jgi:hypothetical protein
MTNSKESELPNNVGVINQHTESWKKEFEKKCVGTVDGERFAFVPLTLAFIDIEKERSYAEGYAEGRVKVVDDIMEEIVKKYGFEMINMQGGRREEVVRVSDILSVINEESKEI